MRLRDRMTASNDAVLRNVIPRPAPRHLARDAISDMVAAFHARHIYRRADFD